MLLSSDSADLISRHPMFWVQNPPILSKPGIVAGIILVFTPALGEFVVPAMLGGTYATIGTITWDLFLRYHNWWKGSALSVIYIAIVLIAIGIYIKRAGKIEI